MAMQLTRNNSQRNGADSPKDRMLHDVERQCLRILRCTAIAFANSPGGLHFEAGTRPWLDALTQRQSAFFLQGR
ncbi:MAG: hypothetical protein RIR09_2595 [Pseudomonadota bacterium]|jgi:hypothetical protein